MQQPDHDLRAFQSSPLSPRRFVAIGVVVLVHLVVIWALATGLAQNFIKRLPDEFKAEVVKEAPPPPQKAPPPPPPQLKQPPPPFVPPPEINISEPSTSNNSITVQSKVRTAPPPPPPAPAPKIEGARGIESSHSKPPYPPISARLGEHGTVLMMVTVGTDGSVLDVKIEKSSGYSRLDDAAKNWVKDHWRYHPATENGKPIVSRTQVRYTFNLNE